MLELLGHWIFALQVQRCIFPSGIMGFMKKAQRVVDMLLEEGRSVATIVEATGLSRRAVYYAKARRRRALSDAAEAEVTADIPAPAEELGEALVERAHAAGLSKAEIAAILEVDEASIVVDASAQERYLLERLKALKRLAAEKPDKWLAMQEDRK